MNTINAFASKTPKLFLSHAWVISSSQQKTAGGLRNFRYRLFIQGKEYDAFLWVRDDDRHWPISIGSHVELSGKWVSQKKNGTIQITKINKVNDGASLKIARNLYQGEKQDQVDQLISFIGRLQSPTRQFLYDLFSDAEIASKFVLLPASLKHHHAFAGGLLEHSLECALMCGQLGLPWLNRMEAELTMVGALLHDIGKIRTYQIQNRFTDTGHFVGHEVLTLEVIGHALNRLEKKWPAGANLLRHILTWEQSRGGHPAFPGTLMVKMSDRLSTGLSRRDEAFSHHPKWHYQARNDEFKNEKFLRIPETL